MKEQLKTIDIKGKKYVTVAERVRYFNEAYPQGKIDTEILSHESGTVLMKATVIPEIDKPERFFTGYAQEEKGKGMVNATSYIENCQTSAVGRALAMMGTYNRKDMEVKATLAVDCPGVLVARRLVRRVRAVDRPENLRNPHYEVDQGRDHGGGPQGDPAASATLR